MDHRKLNQFPAVAANATSTLVTNELAGMSVHCLALELGGTDFTKAHITNLRIGMDGKDLLNGISGAELQELNGYSGLPDDANYLYFFFGDPTARTIRGQHLGDLDLDIYRSPLEIEVQIAGATAPTLRIHAWTGVPKVNMGVGYNKAEASILRALVRSIISPTAAVTRQSFSINTGSRAGARMRSLNLFHANLTSVEFRKEGFIKHDDISVAANDSFQNQYARSPVTGLYVLDRIVDGNQGEAETTVRGDGNTPWNVQLNLTTSGGDVIKAFADVHAALPLL